MNLLGSAAYDPAAAVSKSTATLLALTALDTTNLRLAITVPAHGKVKFIMYGTITGATTVPSILFGVLNGATVLKRAAPIVQTGTQDVATRDATAYAEFTVTGLTPGAMNVDAAYAVQVVVAATNIKYGGPNDATGNDAWGAFVFEAWDPQPIPTAAPGVANGLLISGSNAGTTTLGALTVTGALTVNGVSNVSQTGDSFARLGAPVGASHSADVAAVQADTDNIQTRLPAALTAGGNMKSDALALGGTVQTGRDIGLSVLLTAADSQTFATGTATAGAATTITLQTALGADNLPNGSLIKITSGTGAKQTRTVVGYVDSTKVTTVDRAWTTNPDATSVYALVYEDQPKIDSSLQVTIGTNNDKTGYALSAAGVQAIWDALTSALTTVGSVGKRIGDNLDALISSRMATYTQPTGFLAATFPGTVASTTNITAGVITTVTNLTNAATSGDFTAVMKTSLNAATPAVTVSDKTGFSLSAAGVQAIWDALTSALTTVGSVGKRIADNLDATISSRASPTNITAGTITTATNLTNAPTSGDFTAVMKTSLNAATPAVTVSDKTGFSLSAAGVQAIWDALTSALTTVGSVGKRIADNLDAAITTRLSTAGYTAPPSVAVIADGVWDEVLSGHLTATTTGAALNGAGSAGDPWTTALPGAYGAGTAGNIVAAIKGKTDNLPTDPADASDIAAAISGLNNLSAAGVRSALGLASANLDTQLDALPTNAELATALAGADDATLAAIAALSIPTSAAIADEVATRTIKANILKINDVTLKGVGTSGDKWGPV